MNRITERQLRQHREQGYFVTEPQWSAKELAEVAAEFDHLIEENIREAERSDDAQKLAFAKTRPFIGMAHKKSPLLARFVKSPVYVEACARLIGPDADLYYNQIVVKPPEKGRSFNWHQDSGYTITKPLEYITCWTAIGRAFVENGCIWVIPGSHKRGLIEHRLNEQSHSTDAVIESEEDALPVEMQAGQVAIFNSLLLHKSGPNVSREVRRAYVPQYHHARVVRADNGQPLGDRVPIVRRGRPV
jgi:ectoine hydroxylase-related dioxygenase (phytanoyl-CoA dioxygenase family)